MKKSFQIMKALISHPFATAHADNSVRHLNKYILKIQAVCKYQN